jgi:nitrite reductase/ring-hydroxylating ferredoxin subunit
MSETTRRSVLTGAAGVTAAVALSACNKKEPEDGANGVAGQPGTATSKAPDTATKPAGAIAAATDIQVGGGKIFAEQKVVVTQPTAGNFKGFDITCTHQGCPVSKIEGANIVCECHQSAYKIADGSVARGPATRPLVPKSVKVENGQIKLA